MRKVFANQPAFSVDDLRNYDIMKEKLAIRVVSTERNAEMLENIPHKEVEDMSMRIHPEEKNIVTDAGNYVEEAAQACGSSAMPTLLMWSGGKDPTASVMKS